MPKLSTLPVCHPSILCGAWVVVTQGKSRMRKNRLSGSVEGVVSNHNPYSDILDTYIWGRRGTDPDRNSRSGSKFPFGLEERWR